MEYTTLGKTDCRVSQLCFGCGPLGVHGFGTVDVDSAKAAVAKAVDSGINFFDTSDIYGLGKSESLLAEALGDRIRSVVVATKFGVRHSPEGKVIYDCSPRWIESALTDSLARLGVSCIDLYQMHYWDGVTPIREILDTLDCERRRGRIRFVGLTNISEEMLDDILLPPFVVSFQKEFSLAARENETSIRILQSKGLTCMGYGALGQGILSGKYNGTSTFCENDRRIKPSYRNFHGATLATNLKLVEVMRYVATEIRSTLPQLAVRWALEKIPGTIPIVGFKTPEQVEDIVEAFRLELSKEYLDLLSSVR